MIATYDTPPDSNLCLDLQVFQQLCTEAMTLVRCENEALRNSSDYQASEFDGQRKRLLAGLESALIRLSKQRQNRRQNNYPEEIKGLLQTIQSLLMKVLLLDRENQQALLRRGLVPARHLPPVAAQRPHYAAGLYSQNSRG